MKRGKLVTPSRRDALLVGLGVVITLFGVQVASMIAHARVPVKYQADGLTIKWLPETVRQWESLITEMGQRYNLDPNLIAIIMTLESGGYVKAGSEADAKGLMQIIPPTAADIADRYLKTPVKKYDIWDPRTNIEFGTAYLALLRNEFGTAKQGPEFNSTVELIAAGYNGGPGAANNLEQGKGLSDPQTVVYSRDAFNMWRERHAERSPTFERWKERGGSELLNLAANAE